MAQKTAIQKARDLLGNVVSGVKNTLQSPTAQKFQPNAVPISNFLKPTLQQVPQTLYQGLQGLAGLSQTANSGMPFFPKPTQEIQNRPMSQSLGNFANATKALGVFTSPTQQGIGGLLGMGLGGLQDRGFKNAPQNFAQGVGMAQQYTPIFNLTNPLMVQGLSKLPISGAVSSRLASGLANVGQGYATAPLAGNKYSLGQAGLDFAMGAVGGKETVKGSAGAQTVRIPQTDRNEIYRLADAIRSKQTRTPEVIKATEVYIDRYLGKSWVDKNGANLQKASKELMNIADKGYSQAYKTMWGFASQKDTQPSGVGGTDQIKQQIKTIMSDNRKSTEAKMAEVAPLRKQLNELSQPVVPDVRPDSMFGVNPTGKDVPTPKDNPFGNDPTFEKSLRGVPEEGMGVKPVSQIQPEMKTGQLLPEASSTSNIAQTSQLASKPPQLEAPTAISGQTSSPGSIPPTDKNAFNINLDKMNVSPEAKANLQKAVADINAELKATKGPALTDKEVLGLAQASDALKKVVPREQTAQFTARLTKLRQDVAAGAEGKGISSDFIQNIKILSSTAADTGRRLQKFSIGADSSSNSIKEDIVKELIKLGKSMDEVVAKSKGVDFNNPGQVTTFYREFVKPTLGERLSEYRYINLLSSPKTHIVNAFSNLIQAGVVSPGTKLYSGVIDAFGSALTGKARSHYVSEVPAYYKGLFNGVGDSFKEAVKVLKGEQFVGRPDLNRLSTGSKITKPFQGITRALEASDVLFRGMITSGEKEAIMSKLSKQGKTLSEATINKMAEEKGAYFVFRNAIDSANKSGQGKLLSNIDKFTESIYTLRKVPGVSWFIPFVQTPMNILKQGIEYSPLGVATLPGAANKTEQLAKALMGSTVFAGAAWIAQAGDSTWSAPTSQKDKEAFYASGRQPYSLKIGGQWVSYSRLGPLAYPIAMAASIKYYTQQDPKAATRGKLESVGRSLAGIAKFFSDQSYMTGLGDLVKTIQGDVTAAKQFATNAPSQLIPLEALVGWVARIVDPIYRKPGNMVDQLKTQLPLLSKQVAPYTNPGGEPSVRENNAFNSFSPVTVTPNNQSFGNMLNNSEQMKRFSALDTQFKDLVKSGDVPGAMALMKANQEIFKQGGILKSQDSQMTRLRSARDAIMANKSLSQERKDKILKIISQSMQQTSNQYSNMIGGVK